MQCKKGRSTYSARRLAGDRLAGWGAGDRGFGSRFLRGDFSGPRHTTDLKIGTPVATLPGAWRDRVSAGTSWLGEGESVICNFYLSVAVRKLSEQIRP